MHKAINTTKYTSVPVYTVQLLPNIYGQCIIGGGFSDYRSYAISLNYVSYLLIR